MSIGFEDVAIGDSVLVDNSDFLAYANFTRHQNEDIPELDVFRVDGRPVFPQRAQATGSPELYFVAPYEAAFDQKMIVVQNTHDAQCWPCATENLRRLVTARRGTRCRSAGVVHASTRCISRPAPSARRAAAGAQHPARRLPRSRAPSRARHDRLGRGRHRATGRHELRAVGRRRGGAAARRGRAPGHPAGRRRDGQRRCARRRRVGDTVELEVLAQLHRPAAPSSRSSGTSTARVRSRCGRTASTARARTCASRSKTPFDAPGVYFPCVRVTAHRDGDVSSPQRRLVNLARVRVVVTG